MARMAFPVTFCDLSPAKKTPRTVAGSSQLKTLGERLLLLLVGWPRVYFGIDSYTHGLQCFQPLFSLGTPSPIRIEFDRFLIGLLGTRLQYGHQLVAVLLEVHRIHQRRTQQIPCL